MPRRTAARLVAELEALLAERDAAVAALERRVAEGGERERATQGVLRAISRAPGSMELDAVLKAVVEGACRVCGAVSSSLQVLDGDDLIVRAAHGDLPARPLGFRLPVGRGSVVGRAVLDGRPVQVA